MQLIEWCCGALTSSSLVAVLTESMLCDNTMDGIGTICPIEASMIDALGVCCDWLKCLIRKCCCCCCCWWLMTTPFCCCCCSVCCAKQFWIAAFVVDITEMVPVFSVPLVVPKMVEWWSCDRWIFTLDVSDAIEFTICGRIDKIGDAGWYFVVEHSLFGDKTCGALAGDIGSAGLRLIAVDEMVNDFSVSVMNRTPYVSTLKRYKQQNFVRHQRSDKDQNNVQKKWLGGGGESSNSPLIEIKHFSISAIAIVHLWNCDERRIQSQSHSFSWSLL